MQQDYTPGQTGRFKMFELLRQSNQATQTMEKLSRADARELDDSVVQDLRERAAQSLHRQGASTEPTPIFRPRRARLWQVLAALRPAT